MCLCVSLLVFTFHCHILYIRNCICFDWLLLPLIFFCVYLLLCFYFFLHCYTHHLHFTSTLSTSSSLSFHPSAFFFHPCRHVILFSLSIFSLLLFVLRCLGFLPLPSIKRRNPPPVLCVFWENFILLLWTVFAEVSWKARNRLSYYNCFPQKVIGCWKNCVPWVVWLLKLFHKLISCLNCVLCVNGLLKLFWILTYCWN